MNFAVFLHLLGGLLCSQSLRKSGYTRHNLHKKTRLPAALQRPGPFVGMYITWHRWPQRQAAASGHTPKSSHIAASNSEPNVKYSRFGGLARARLIVNQQKMHSREPFEFAGKPTCQYWYQSRARAFIKGTQGRNNVLNDQPTLPRQLEGRHVLWVHESPSHVTHNLPNKLSNAC
jgi:hypothetical protein